MAFTFTENRSSQDELDVTATCLDPDTSGVYTYPIQDFDDEPSVSIVTLGTGFYTGSWRVTVTRTSLTITKLAAGGTASGGARLFIKRGR